MVELLCKSMVKMQNMMSFVVFPLNNNDLASIHSHFCGIHMAREQGVLLTHMLAIRHTDLITIYKLCSGQLNAFSTFYYGLGALGEQCLN